MSQIQTRIVDSMDYDDVCDVIKWLQDVVGARVTLTDDPPDEHPRFLFWVEYPWGDPPYPVSSGDQITWDPSTKGLGVTPDNTKS